MRFGLRELIFLVVLLSVPIASFVFVFKPRNEEIRQATREIDIKQEKLAKLDQVSSRISDMNAAIEEWRSAVEKIEAKLPSQQGIDSILEQVWTTAQKNKLVIISNETQAPVPASTYMELPMKIEMEGDFDAFYQFLLELEQLDRITRIHQLEIERVVDKQQRRGRSTSQQEEIPDGWMKANFVLSIFYEAKKDGNLASAE